jgi:DNA gyrase subunit A
MSVVRHVKVSVEDRESYLQAVNASRRLAGGDYTDRAEDKARDEELTARLQEPLFMDMMENEEFIITITEDGMGKRTSAFEYRIAKRGGQGITGIDLGRGKGNKDTSIVAAFGVTDEDQLVMVSDGGQIIRCPVDTVSIVGRASRGVTLFKTADGERVVSVSRLRDVANGDEDGEELEDVEGGEPDAPPTDSEQAAATDGAGDETPDAEEGS